MKKQYKTCSYSVLATLIILLSGCVRAQNVNPNLIITGAKVFIDKQTGFKNLDIGIKDDKIVFIGNAATQNFKSQNIIEAKGKILSPGFIDPHTHLYYDLSNEDRKANLPYLLQGVTTIVTGNDGSSPLPIGERLDEWQKNASRSQ